MTSRREVREHQLDLIKLRLDLIQLELHPERPKQPRLGSSRPRVLKPSKTELSISPMKNTQNSARALTPSLSRFERPRLDPVGPGKYDPVIKSASPSAAFGFEKRFTERLDEWMIRCRLFTRERTPEQHLSLSARVMSNVSMEQYKPQNRMKLLEDKAAQLQAKIEAAKAKRQAMIDSKNSQRVAKIRERQYLSSIKKREIERLQIRHSWSIAFVMIGVCSASTYIIPNRIKLHQRAIHLIRFLCVISKALGKFKISLHQLRKNNAIKSLRVLGTYAKLWSKVRRRRKGQRVAECLEKGITQALLFKLMSEWRRRITRIQRGMRWLLLWKRIRYRRMVIGWEEFEVRTERLQIPKKIKEILVREHAKKLMLAHIALLRAWKIDCDFELKNYEENYYLQMTDHVLTGSLKSVTLVLPPKPIFKPVIRAKDFEQLYESAERSRLRWGWMAKQYKLAVKPSYKRC